MEAINHTPVVYVVIRDTVASLDGRTFKQFKEGERLVADTAGKKAVMWEFERLGIVKRVAASQAEKVTKVTRAPSHK